MAALNTNTSIVDYLKSVGKDNSYGARTNLYNTANLNMGAYTGSAQQNVALLNYLKGSGGGSAPAPAAAPAASPTPAPTVAAPTAQPAAMPRTDFVTDIIKQMQEGVAKAKQPVDTARQALIDFYAKLPSATDRYTKLRDEQGVAQQEELVNALARQAIDTTDLIEKIDPAVTERTGDFLVTEGQRTSMVARDQKPLLENLNKLLRNKEREEIGLSGKQNLVQQLLQLSFQDDTLRARPLQMGVDYSVEDMNMAIKLLSDSADRSTEAFFGDQSASESRQSAAESRAFEEMMTGVRQKNAIELENLSSKNSLSNSLTLKNLTKVDEKKAQQTDDTWNSILGRSKNEYDVWKDIDTNQKEYRAKGIDVDALWSAHSALAGKVGVGGDIRSSSLDEMQQLMLGISAMKQ